MADYATIPRPPWMYNTTPYLQQLYQNNKAQIDAQWQAWVAQNPNHPLATMNQTGTPQSPGFSPAGNPSYTGGNFPSGGGPTQFNVGPSLPGMGGGSGPGFYGPGGNWTAGSPSGDFGTQSSGGGDPSWWQQLILQGIPVVTNYLQANQQAGQAQNLQNAANKNRAATLGYASPERYLQNYAGYLGAFKESYRPWLVGEQDRAAIGEQGALQSFDTDVARRGLSGSGLALAGRSAIRTGRQAQIGNNMRQYWQMTDEAARGAADQTRSAEISASLGAPYTYVPRPSPGVAAVQGLGDAYRDYLWLQGTQNNPFRSMKDQQPRYGW